MNDVLDLEALLQSFLGESEEGLGEMEQALLALESRPSDPEPLRTIFRVAHTLKGNALTLGFPALGGFAHALEDLLDRLRNGEVHPNPALITTLLRATDRLRALVPAAVAGADALSPADQALQDALRHPQRLAAPAPVAAAREPRRAPARRSLRVDLERLDRIMALTGEIAVARVRLGQMLEEGRPAASALDVHRDIDRLSRELHEQVMKVRAVPVGAAFRPQARTVRDAAAACEKEARLILEGEQVEADTAVVDGIRDPLTHMVRNAVAHGLESPQERLAAGKDRCGTVTLRARQEGGNLVIEVIDDGRGFDRALLIEAARRAEIPGADQLDDARLHQLAFEPGFTTAEAVTEVSGRGVGLDVVRRGVEALRGTVSVASEPGKGCTLTLRLPLALAIIDGFSVAVSGSTWIVPMESVLECLDLPAEGARGDDGGVINLRDQALPYLRLRSVFDLPGEPPARECMVVVQHGLRRAGLVVDQLHGAGQVVVRPLGELLRGTEGVAGSAILGTGRVALIADVEALLSRALRRNRSPESPDTGAAP